MKVYLIYRHGINGFQPFLYAFTNDKKIKESFMKERKKEMFACTTKELTEKEYKRLCNHNSGYILGRRGFETKSSSSFNDKTNVFITATMAEEISVYSAEDKVMVQMSKFIDYESRYFNSDILKALSVLLYFNIQKFTLNGLNDWFLEGLSKEEIFYDDY